MKILIAGDFYPKGKVKTLIDDKKYEAVLGEVAPIVESADYSIVNYESPVVLGDYKPIVKCGPNLASSENGVEAIKWAGFDMATLANNHTYDFGAEGLNDTIKTCEKYGIDIVGVGRNLSEAQKVFYKEIDGKKLAIINCCEHEFSIADENTPGANPLNPVQQFYQIQEARKNADYVLVIVHDGHEHFQLPSPRMVETYRFFIDAGADAVVNHHQHCYSGYEVYKEKLIFYGLGNFCFERPNHKDTFWNEGYMVEINFDSTISFELYPYNQCGIKDAVCLTRNDEKFVSELKRINEIISDTKELERQVNQYYADCSRSVSSAFEPYEFWLTRALFYKGFLPSIMKRKWKVIRNYIECESHRDKVNYMLKDLINA